MTILVMTREMGTLGKDVARSYSDRTGCAVYHHELVLNGQRGSNGESEVFRFLEATEEEMNRWRMVGSNGFYTPSDVLELALAGNALFRGWGATRLLKSLPNVLAVRICAPMEFRVETMRKRLGTDAETARREIERSDAAHSRSFLRFFTSDWRDALNYDLVLNTADLGVAACTDILMDAVGTNSFGESEALKLALQDRLTEERIRDAFSSGTGLGERGHHVHASVTGGEVRLYGLVHDSEARSMAQNLAARHAGDRILYNEIAQVGPFE